MASRKLLHGFGANEEKRRLQLRLVSSCDVFFQNRAQCYDARAIACVEIMVALTMACSAAPCARVVPRRGASSVSSRRRGAVVIRASADDASGVQATTNTAEDTASASSSYGEDDSYIPYTLPPRRESPLERVVRDPFAAAIMAPRVALGGLDLLSKGELFALAAGAPGEVSALLNDPRPIQDKAADVFRRAEEMVEMLEKRGVAAEAPGRELVRPAIPADLYEKYLDPAAIEPAPTKTSTASSTAYTAEPAWYPTTREVEIPDLESFGGASSTKTAPVAYAASFDDAEDAAVAAAAAAVAAALWEEEGDSDADSGGDVDETSVSGSRDDVQETREQASTSASAAGTKTKTETRRASPAFDAPAPPADAWSAVKEAETFAAEFVMSQSAAIASKEAE